MGDDDALSLNPGMRRASTWTRRGAVAAMFAGVALAFRPDATFGQASPTILLVSRKRLLNDTAHARYLLETEIAMNAELQQRVDQVKQELADKEKELARLRPTLARDAFDIRVAEFDRLVRSQRRQSQKHAASLQNVFRAERLKLLNALGPLLESVRAEYGASVILNLDQALTSDPALDITNEVIARFNAFLPPLIVPDLDTLLQSTVPTDGAAVVPE